MYWVVDYRLCHKNVLSNCLITLFPANKPLTRPPFRKFLARASRATSRSTSFVFTLRGLGKNNLTISEGEQVSRRHRSCRSQRAKASNVNFALLYYYTFELQSNEQVFANARFDPHPLMTHGFNRISDRVWSQGTLYTPSSSPWYVVYVVGPWNVETSSSVKKQM